MSEQEPGASAGNKFDPTRYMRQLRGRGGTTDYLDVKWRLVWLRSEHPDAQISTEHVTIGDDMAIFKATVAIPDGGSATGYGSETARDFGDFIEKAETKALGRALIALGYGTQFAQEFGEDEGVEAAGPRAGEGPVVRPPSARATPPARPPAPRTEPILADSRRPATVRPLREAEPEEMPAPPPAPMPTLDPAPAPVARGREDVAPADDATAPAASAAGAATEAPAPDDDVPPRLARPARAEAAAPSQRLSPPQPVPRPAPRPTPIAQALATGEGEGDEAIDMANYGWTEFWSWARKRGYTDRKSLDAVVGRPTNGMTPLEIRKQIQAKQQG